MMLDSKLDQLGGVFIYIFSMDITILHSCLYIAITISNMIDYNPQTKKHKLYNSKTYKENMVIQAYIHGPVV